MELQSLGGEGSTLLAGAGMKLGGLFGNVDVYLIIKDDFLSVFQQPEEDAPALQMMTAVFICHLYNFLPFSCVLTPDNLPSLLLSLAPAAEAARLAVAGQTEPSQVFL